MFQYAFFLSLKNRFKNVKADISDYTFQKMHHGFELERIFPIRLDKIKRHAPSNPFIRKVYRIYYTIKNFCFQYRERQEDYYHFNEKLYKDAYPYYYKGFWQNEDYFKGVGSQLRQDFTFKLPLSTENSEIIPLIQQPNTVALHVRRGDYLNLGWSICDLDYYTKAITRINELVGVSQYFIFSDDIATGVNKTWLLKALFISTGIKERIAI